MSDPAPKAVWPHFEKPAGELPDPVVESVRLKERERTRAIILAERARIKKTWQAGVNRDTTIRLLYTLARKVMDSPDFTE